MNITIAGYGFVGKAMEAYLQEVGSNVRIVDPALSKTNIRGTHPDGVVICVNTPALPDWSCDMSNVFDVINDTPYTIPESYLHQQKQYSVEMKHSNIKGVTLP